MKVLAVSPHMDDAVLSAGGRIFDLTASGHEVVVMTMFAGSAFPPYSPLARSLHELWGLAHDPVSARRLEDARALAGLRAEPWHADFLDAIYRRDLSGWQFAEEAALTAPHEDADLRAKLYQAVHEALATRPDLVLTAAAVGMHVDHVVVRDAVVGACRDSGIPVRLWQDLPYAAWAPRVPPDIGLGAAERVSMSSAAWRAKCAAVACYASQLPVLWPGQADFRVPLAAHAAFGPGDGFAETFWPVHVAAGPWRA